MAARHGPMGSAPAPLAVDRCRRGRLTSCGPADSARPVGPRCWSLALARTPAARRAPPGRRAVAVRCCCRGPAPSRPCCFGPATGPGSCRPESGCPLSTPCGCATASAAGHAPSPWQAACRTDGTPGPGWPLPAGPGLRRPGDAVPAPVTVPGRLLPRAVTPPKPLPPRRRPRARPSVRPPRMTTARSHEHRTSRRRPPLSPVRTPTPRGFAGSQGLWRSNPPLWCSRGDCAAVRPRRSCSCVRTGARRLCLQR